LPARVELTRVVIRSITSTLVYYLPARLELTREGLLSITYTLVF
jgi:hypothetical protein